MRTKLVLTTLVCVALFACVRPEHQKSVSLAAEPTWSPGQPGRPRALTFSASISHRMSARYLLHLPEEYGRNPDQRWPLIVYLHGGSRRGTELDSVRVLGLPRRLEGDPKFPFIVLSPQADAGTLWTDTELLIALMDEVSARYAIDPARVYLTGHSMGGNGTWYLAYAHPERFAAIAPMSGPGNSWWATRLKDMPTWVFHGAEDDIVPLRESEEMVDALRKAGNDHVRFTVLPERGHGIVNELYLENSELYDWFLKHHRP